MEPVPALVPLPQPRPLTGAEHALVARLVSFADVAELSEQLADVRAVSACDCGCASVGLRSDGPPVPAPVVARLSDTGRDDYFAVSASAASGASVVLHVLSGSVGELELFAGDGVQVALPEAGGLTGLTIG